MPKFNFQKLFDNNKFVIALSVLIAIGAMFVVKLTIDNTSTMNIKDVPVEIDLADTAAEKAELSVIGDQELTATLNVTGKRYDVGGLKAADLAEDLRIVIKPTAVTKAGEYQLELTVERKQNALPYTINSISPSKVTLRFDNVVTRELPITVETGTLETAEGFIQEPAFAQPDTITVKGPKGDVDQIARCLARSDISGVLTETVIKKGEILFYDKDNNKLEFDFDYSPKTVDVTVPVYMQRTVPLTFSYSNVPEGFPIDALTAAVKLSHKELTIATPGDAVEGLKELSLGTIDFRKIDRGSVFSLEINLPAGYRNMDNVDRVTVEFPTQNIDSKTITISNLNLTNVPRGYEVSLLTKRLANVKIVGEASIVKSVTAADVVASVDLLDVTMTKGRFSVPIKFSIPNKGLVWVSGEYSAVIEAAEK